MTCLVQALGYMGFTTPRRDKWEQFASEMLGMQVVPQALRETRLRMDGKAHRYTLVDGEQAGVAFLGFEVSGPEALGALYQALATRGKEPQWAPDTLLRRRGVQGMFHVLDPDGHRVEFYHHLENDAAPFTPPKPIGGFRTDPLGLGHIVLYTPNYAAMSQFYQETLSFRLSDFHHEPFAIEFLRVNPRHHSFALIADKGPSRIHHVMAEYNYWDDVGRAYDLALAHPDRIAVSLGRHLNDHVTSFYLWTPDDFFIELGWAGRSVDDATWVPSEIRAPSLWGHVRYWQTPEKRAQTKKMIEAVGQDGLRAPVAVTGEGPFNLPKKG